MNRTVISGRPLINSGRNTQKRIIPRAGRGVTLFILAFYILLAFSASATSHITRFAFVTEPRTVAPGEISEEITVQAQDAAGNAVSLGETVDLEFISSSASGEFLNSEGKPASQVMNSNWKNRTFYYRDSAEGSHTLKIKATGRVSGKSWEASQKITVSEDNSSSPSSGANSESPSTGSGTNIYSSSGVEKTPSIKAYAGEDKTVAVGSEINFFGSATGLNGKPLENARFWWNFGDGASKEGRSVGHVFMIPGEYTVGLHVSTGEYAASDYLKVSVIPNQIEVSGVLIGEKGYLKIKNPAAVEIEIGGWIVEDAAGQRFIIPPKTKIGSGAEIALANSTTGLFLNGEAQLTIYYSNLIKAREWKCLTSGVSQFCSTAGVEHETVIPGQVMASVTKQAYGIAASSSASAGVSADKLAPRNAGEGDSLSAAQDDKTENKPASSETDASAFAQLSESPRAPQLLFVTAFLLSILAAAGFLISKKFIA